MRKIAPCLWFNDQAEEAARFYTALFGGSRIVSTARYGEAGPGPKGSVMTVIFQVLGMDVMALNGGPAFTHTPALSFFVSLGTKGEVDALWRGLSEGGTVLMDLGEHPFSALYGWVQDRFGVSWQLSLADGPARIAPFLMFSGTQLGKAEEAMRLYASLFPGSSLDPVERDGDGRARHAGFRLDGQGFIAFDSAMDHAFTFTPAFSLFVSCGTQEEVDRLWERLSDGGVEVQCGWVTDRFGVSWQIVPEALGRLMGGGSPEQSKRVMTAMLQMKKLDVEGLRRAAEGG
jgi:predicted 3-demethylubiquinone-9 3-methyltransferase (glyoxalase superfamily)